MRITLTMLAAFVLISTANAQIDNVAALQKLETRVFQPDSADSKLRGDYLRQLRDDANKRDVEAWRAIKTKDDWEKFRDERLAKLRASLGRFPDAPKSVKVVTTKKLQGDGFTVENIIYESRPSFYVTANLYVPEKADKPMPGFIVVHSHHNPKTQSELQDMGILWAKQGCLVLIPDMVGHGERRQHAFADAKSYPEKFEIGRQDYRYRYNTALQLHLVGESLMGWMVWDLMRGVDVLYQRPNLDKSKVMVFGSVAGGGDPCAVFAALEPRITAAAPFNFGGPQPETKFPLPDDAELAFNYVGGGSWESTRNLKLSARDGFLPWLIVGSIAPRGLIYGHEFAWDEKRDPVWARFQKIWGFYDAKDKLAAATGRGSVKGQAPESTHCNNIGYEHRKPIYPTLTKWFGLSVPVENKKRFDSSELQCWTDEARKNLKPMSVIERVMKDRLLLGVTSGPRTWAPISKDSAQRLLGISRLDVKPTIDRVSKDTRIDGANFVYERIIIRNADDPKMAVPAIILRPQGKIGVPNIVIAIAQDGKAGFLKHRTETIAELLKAKVAVCLPDLRGTGETANDGRSRQSGGTSYSATLLMHGQTTPGVQVQELVAVMRALPSLGYKSIALWGDSFADPNDPKMTFGTPLDVSKMPRQSEPMGGTVALLGGLLGGDAVKGVYVRGGLADFQSLLKSPYCYFPHDAVIPGILAQPRHDLPDIVVQLKNRGVRQEALVDGWNRRVDAAPLASSAEVAAWLVTQVKK